MLRSEIFRYSRCAVNVSAPTKHRLDPIMLLDSYSHVSRGPGRHESLKTVARRNFVVMYCRPSIFVDRMLWNFASGWLPRWHGSADESIGLRIRGSGVRISPSAPKVRPDNKGYLVVLVSFRWPFSCCWSLLSTSNKINGLPIATNHSVQHGRNMALPGSFSSGYCFDHGPDKIRSDRCSL
jgi:hypothetical protein